MSNLILKTPELQGIEKSKAAQIKSTFEPMVTMLESFEDVYNEIIKNASKEITSEITTKAKRIRLDIAKVRIETGKLKDKQKEYIKLEDKAIMGVHNIIVWAVKEKEDKLKEIENHFEILEQKRKEKLQADRAEKLSKYVEDAFERDLVKFEEDEFEALFAMKKQAYEDKIAAEKKAEAERIAKEKAEAKEREQIKRENELLKAEAEKREKLAKIEKEKREKAEVERKKQEAIKQKKEREAHELALRKEREANERLLKAEAEKREKLANQLKAKKEKEERLKREEEAKKEAELQKGDSDKWNDLVIDLNNIKTNYAFKSKENTKKYNDVKILIDKIINHIS